MLKAPCRSRWRRWVWRWRLTFSSRSRVRLMASPIIRRSSSICFSPGPPRTPAPPVWRSRWDQRRTSRVLTYCRRASSTCSLPSWLRARCAKISRMSRVRSLTGRSRWRSRLRCCAGLRDWSNRTSVAPVCSASALISSALPLPMNSAASGALRLQATRATGASPAVCASRPSSSSSRVEMRQAQVHAHQDGGSAGACRAIRRNSSRGSGGGSVKTARAAAHGPARGFQVAPASVLSAVVKFTARPGTMVEMACL